MERRIQIFFILAVVIFLMFIIHLLRTKKLNIRYTLIWLFLIAILLIVSIFPSIVYFITDFIGIKTPINSALIIAGIFVIIIIISITSIVSELNKKIRILVQELAIVKKELRDLKEEKQ